MKVFAIAFLLSECAINIALCTVNLTKSAVFFLYNQPLKEHVYVKAG